MPGASAGPRLAAALAAAGLALAGCLTAPAATAPPVAIASERLAPGSGTFTFTGWAGPALPVWHHVPARVTAATPVVFVMHGNGRDADRYRNEWAPLAEQRGFILVVPEFSRRDFPTADAYNSGYFAEPDGAPRPKAKWSYSAIEPLFEAVKARTGSRVRQYGIYGHSAGGQFVHRYVLFMPEARYHTAVAANAGWYTLPELDREFPYGLKNAPPKEATLAGALRKPLVILLGTADTDPNSPNLRHTPEAEEQGPHRFARGHTFFRSAQAAAARLGVPLGWRMQYVEGVGHNNAGMAAAAAPLLVP